MKRTHFDRERQEQIARAKAIQLDMIKNSGKRLAEKHKRMMQDVINARFYDVDDIKRAIMKSDEFVERSLLVLYSFQTPLEQTSGTTRVHNNKGFNAVDAEILSSFAEYCDPKHNRYLEGYRLTVKQRNLARRKLIKYSRQLRDYANSRVKTN